jgi:maltose alpha-D-glucosyltransferase/alpha-amylase
VGRVLGLVRNSLSDLPAAARESAGRVLAAEDEIFARFEWLKTQPIDAQRIRIHGNLHLERVLFTGRDYVLLGVGPNRRRLSERKRKRSALRDVASMVRSFQQAAASSLRSLRPEDQARGEPYSWIWARWASASFLRGYLEAAGNAPFVGRRPAVTALLLETELLDQALRDLQFELRRRSPTIAIPLHGILDILRRDADA